MQEEVTHGATQAQQHCDTAVRTMASQHRTLVVCDVVMLYYVMLIAESLPQGRGLLVLWKASMAIYTYRAIV